MLFMWTMTGTGSAILRLLAMVASTVFLFVSGLKFSAAAGCGHFPRSWRR